MFIKKVKRPFSGRLPCWVLGIGSRHWFFQISHQFNQSKKQGRVALVPLSNPLIQSSLKNMLKKETNFTCLLVQGVLTNSTLALKPIMFKCELEAWSHKDGLSKSKWYWKQLVTRHRQTPSMPRSLCMDHEYDVKHPNTPLSQIHPHISPRSKLRHTLDSLDVGLIWFWMLSHKIRVKILDKVPNSNHHLIY